MPPPLMALIVSAAITYASIPIYWSVFLWNDELLSTDDLSVDCWGDPRPEIPSAVLLVICARHIFYSTHTHQLQMPPATL